MKRLYRHLFVCRILPLSLLLMSSSGFADILMIDLNGNPQERKAVEAAASLRHEAPPVFVGSIPGDDRHRQLVNEREKAINQLYQNETSRSPAQSKKLKDRIDALSQQISEFQQYKEVRLENDLARLTLQKRNITTLIISGHHGQGKFFGTNGTLDAEKIRRALAYYPELSTGLRTIILAGCYSATPGAIENHWKSLAPNLNLIAGFDALAPKGATIESPLYLSEILGKEKDLLAATDKKSLVELFRRIKVIRSVNASVYVNNLFVDRHGIYSMDELKAKCDEAASGNQIDKMNETIACYESAEDKKCENPPADTLKGELRKVYNAANTLSLCNDMLRAQGKEPPDADHVLRLIFYRKVARNVSVNHRDDLQNLDQALSQLGFQKNELLGSLADLSRKEAVSRIRQAQAKIEQRLADRDIMAGPLGAAAIQAQEQLSGLENTISKLLPSCTPQTWIEGTSRERSNCLRSLDTSSLARLSAVGFAAALEFKISQEISKNDSGYQAAKREKDRLEELLANSTSMSDPDKLNVMRQLRAARIKLTEAANEQSRMVHQKTEEEFEKEISRRRERDPRFRGSAGRERLAGCAGNRPSESSR